MKKVLAFFLTFALLLVPFSTLSMAASSYTDVTLIGTDGWNTSVSGDNWILYLTTNGYESDDWSYKYYGFTYEYNGVTGTTTQVSSVDGNRLYCTIPTSAVPATDGVSFTIKAGRYEPEAGTTVGLNILNDFTVVSVDGRLVGTQVIFANNVETFNGNANSFYFYLKDSSGNKIGTGVESWDNFLSPSYCDGTRILEANWTNTYSGVFVDGTPLPYWNTPHFKNTGVGEFYIDGLNATAGTKVTVKGHFVSSKQDGWATVGNFFLKELNFIYNGEEWIYYIALTGTYSAGTSISGDNWVLYLTTNGYKSDNWNYKYQGFTYKYNGVTGTTDIVSSTEGNRLYCTIPTSAVPATNGVSFTIKAGRYEPEPGTTAGLNILNDFTVVFVDGHPVGTQVIYANNVEILEGTANSFRFSLKDSSGNGIGTGVESEHNFLSPSDNNGNRIESNGWETTYSGVFVNGTPLNYWNALFKNTGVGEFYIDGLNATAGTKVTVKGHFVSSTQANWTTVGNFFLKELIFTYDGSAWSVEYQGTPEFESHNLILGNNIGFNFLMNLSRLTAEEKAASYMTFSIADSEEEFTQSFADAFESNGKFGFTCTLASLQMAKKIIPIFHYGNGKTITGSPYSINDYTAHIINNSINFSATYVSYATQLNNYFSSKDLIVDGTIDILDLVKAEYNSENDSATYDSVYLLNLSKAIMGIDKYLGTDIAEPIYLPEI